MRLSLPLFSLLLSSFTLAEASSAKDDFMQAMRSTKINNNKKERKRRLTASIMSAVVRKPNNDFHRSMAYYNDDGAANGDDGAANGDDGANAANDDQQGGNDNDDYGGYGFDISSYSLKYAGCSSIATYSDDLAQDEDSETVFETDQYVVFRLCPSSYCDDSSTYGCIDDYGEYMVPIATWLEIMADYRAEEFENYCNYCAACYGGNYYNRKLEDGGNGDDNAGDDAGNGDDNAGNNGNENYNCAYKDACSGYGDVCYNQNNVDYTKFFECKEFDASDDLTLYLGAHCASDKTTIVLGAFTDQYCSNYAGDKYDLGTLTGLTLTSDTLKEYYSSECISCKEGDQLFQANDGDNDGDDVTEVCESLYGYAAKCNRYIGSATATSYQSYQQKDNEYNSCSFIASVVTGSYDEYGYIYVDPMSFEADNKYNEYSVIAIRKGVVTAGQVMGLISFSLLLIGMSVYAALIHVQIKTKTAFSKSKREPLAMNRQNSGIMMARSTTVDTTYQAPDNRQFA